MRMAGRAHLGGLWPQPLVGSGTLACALLVLVTSWEGQPDRPRLVAGGLSIVLLLALGGAIVGAYHFPLHLGPQRKVHMASVAYYLLAVLVAPPLAATVAGVATLAAELSVRAQRGLYASDIASQVGRRVVVVWLGALVAHAPVHLAPPLLTLVGAAIILAVGDLVTYPLVLSPMSGEAPLRVMRAAAREAALVEGAQYLLGLLGALAAATYVWAPLLLLGPTVVVYQALKRAQAAQGRAEDAHQVADAALRVRDDFLLAASHDLRTPLTGVLGRADLLQMHLEGPGPLDAGWLRAQVQALQVAATRMARLADEITDAAHLQMGQHLQLQVEAVDVGALVREMAESVAAASPRGAAPIVVEAPQAGVRLAGDRARLARVLQNVIGNAVKYSVAATPIQIMTARQEGTVTITVRDRGVGIPPAELPHVFTHFYRASTARGIAGSGIGLAGAKTIVEQHGGHIVLESTVDAGTTVTITLPCVVRPPETGVGAPGQVMEVS